MAEKRMFSKTVVDSDAFLDMALSTQALYFHLGMRADDDGFLNNPKKVTRMIGCNEDELKVLIAKNFVIVFDTGVIVIKHWKQHNNVRKDMYKPTIHQREFSMLKLNDDKSYIVNTDPVETKAIASERAVASTIETTIVEQEIEKKDKRFKPPTVEEVRAYCKERQNNVDPEKFVDYYTSNGWSVGKNKMKDWKAAVRTWEKNNSKANFNTAYSNRNPPITSSSADSEYWDSIMPNY